MKKFILSLFLLTVFSGICFSQSKKFEGYDNMPWGTTLEEFKNKNPSAYDKTKADNIIRNEKLYYKDGNSVTRVYRFFDNKLCWGRTVYEDPSEATCDAIIEKLKEEYGPLYDFNEGKDKDNEYFILSWYPSTNLTVMFELQQIYNAYGRVSSTLLFITYQNDKIMADIKNYEKQQKKKNLEL